MRIILLLLATALSLAIEAPEADARQHLDDPVALRGLQEHVEQVYDPKARDLKSTVHPRPRPPRPPTLRPRHDHKFATRPRGHQGGHVQQDHHDPKTGFVEVDPIPRQGPTPAPSIGSTKINTYSPASLSVEVGPIPLQEPTPAPSIGSTKIRSSPPPTSLPVEVDPIPHQGPTSAPSIGSTKIRSSPPPASLPVEVDPIPQQGPTPAHSTNPTKPPSSTVASSSASVPCEEGELDLGTGYYTAGLAAGILGKTINLLDPEEISMATSCTLHTMSLAFAEIAQTINAQAHDHDVGVAESYVELYRYMESNLGMAADAVVAGDFASIRDSLRLFADLLEQAQHSFLGVSSIIDGFRVAGDIASIVAADGELEGTLSFFEDLAAVARLETEDLSATAGAILNITDTEILGWIGPRDPETDECLYDIGGCLSDPALSNWLDLMETDSVETLTTMAMYGIAQSLADSTAPLREVFAETTCTDWAPPGGGGFGTCKDECKTDADCAKENPCHWCEVEIGLRRSKPNLLRKYELTIEHLAKLHPRQNPIGKTLAKLTAKQFKALLKLLKIRQPVLYFKVCYQVCKKRFCIPHPFKGHKRCVEEKSDWIVVPSYIEGMDNGVLPPIDQWDMAKLKAKFDEAVKEACAGK